MKSLYLFFILSFVSISTFAQDFVPGYYIIEPKAEYYVNNPSGDDVGDFLTKVKVTETIEADYDLYVAELTMIEGEVVFATDFSKDIYYAYDPNGRMVAIKGQKSLTKAPIAPGNGVGHIIETIQLISGDELKEGMYVWIIGQDLTKSTITILTSKGQKFEIPQSKIELFTAQLRKEIKDATFKTVN